MKLFSLIMSIAIATSAVATPKIVAHRGDNQFAPQNSVEAAKIAWQNGVKFVEGDFYDTPHGMLCIHGNSELSECAGKKMTIDKLTADDLKNIDLGNYKKWRGKLSAPVRIPTMESIFATVPKDGKIVFEIKGYSQDFAQKVEKARIAAGLSKSQILLISFNSNDIKDFNSKISGYKSLWLYSAQIKNGKMSPTSAEAVKMCKAIGASGVDVGNTELLGAEYVIAVKSAGLEFAVWTIDDPKEFKRMEKIGVDYITTDKACAFTKSQK